MNETPATNRKVSASHKSNWALGGLIAATTAAVVLSISAWAGGNDDMPGRMPPMGMHGMHGDHGGGMPFSGRHLQRLLDEAQATDAQRTQIRQIADKAQADVKALHEQGRTLHEQGLALWAQPKLDAAAAEKLRQQMLAQHDQISKRMLQAMLDVGNVLTPEQRAKVAQQLQKHHEDMQRRMDEHRAKRQPEVH